MGHTDLRVTCDPANVGHAGEFIIWVHIEHILDGQCGTKEITTGRVHDTFRLAR